MTYESSRWRQRLHTVIFESDTRAGRVFDVTLIVCILTSVAVVMLESIAALDARWHREFFAAEMAFTLLFTIEYILRLLAVRRPLAYARSTLGIIDLLAIVPTWLTIFVPGAHLFLTVRILRLLRVFRVLKLTEYLSEAGVLVSALRASRRKISVFLFTVITLVVLMGALIYIVEGPANGFTSIPLSMYWAIVTLTTVGYGDLAPRTPLGQLVASLVMVIGYAIIAVPTGIVTAELTASRFQRGHSRQACPSCGRDGHDEDALHCKYCGSAM